MLHNHIQFGKLRFERGQVWYGDRAALQVSCSTTYFMDFACVGLRCLQLCAQVVGPFHCVDYISGYILPKLFDRLSQAVGNEQKIFMSTQHKHRVTSAYTKNCWKMARYIYMSDIG
jgi:hypothetical protein